MTREPISGTLSPPTVKWQSTHLGFWGNTVIYQMQVFRQFTDRHRQSQHPRKSSHGKTQIYIYYLHISTCDCYSFVSPLSSWRASLVAQTVKNLPAKQKTWVRSPGMEDPLEKGMATHSSILAWRIPWTEEPGGLQFMGSQTAGHNWVTFTHWANGKSWDIFFLPIIYCEFSLITGLRVIESTGYRQRIRFTCETLCSSPEVGQYV